MFHQALLVNYRNKPQRAIGAVARSSASAGSLIVRGGLDGLVQLLHRRVLCLADGVDQRHRVVVEVIKQELTKALVVAPCRDLLLLLLTQQPAEAIGHAVGGLGQGLLRVLLRVGIDHLLTILHAHNDLDMVWRQHLATGVTEGSVHLLNDVAALRLHNGHRRLRDLLVPILFLVEVLLHGEPEIHVLDHVLHVGDGALELLLQVLPSAALLREVLVVRELRYHLQRVGDAVLRQRLRRGRRLRLLLQLDLEHLRLQVPAGVQLALGLLPVEAASRRECTARR
mmetsp:Transcript_32502/g.82817  ORF Transcript_32502/g.82817 Transcript_32502/m.82817 type:complete len:283 (+) Transcript_32502:463-1311(+)